MVPIGNRSIIEHLPIGLSRSPSTWTLSSLMVYTRYFRPESYVILGSYLIVLHVSSELRSSVSYLIPNILVRVEHDKVGDYHLINQLEFVSFWAFLGGVP